MNLGFTYLNDLGELGRGSSQRRPSTRKPLPGLSPYLLSYAFPVLLKWSLVEGNKYSALK